jgi:hypothetical protein
MNDYFIGGNVFIAGLAVLVLRCVSFLSTRVLRSVFSFPFLNESTSSCQIFTVL